MSEMLEKHVAFLRDCLRNGNVPPEYLIDPQEWTHLREELCDEIERREGHRIPYVADYERVNFLLMGIPCCPQFNPE